MDGFLNINKPPGLTSFDVVRVIKRRLPRKYKIGHLGTLDPMATGVLPVALGQANKFLQYIEDQRKEYQAAFFLGATSDTQDIWGKVESSGSTRFTPKQLKEVLQSFLGVSLQVPPMYSAVHHQGKRLYELARQGMVVERTAREIEIDRLELLRVEDSAPWPQITIKVLCSRGTYIRTLGHDIGEKLGTGAVLSQLVRLRSGPFDIIQSVSLEQLENQDLSTYLLPPDFPLGSLPEVIIPEQVESLWRNGRAIELGEVPLTGRVRVYFADHRFLGMAELENSAGTWLHPIRLLI
ncbi:MAG: tRNA pseudouridine(55) synthase TruB [Syntrophomonas sp.]